MSVHHGGAPAGTRLGRHRVIVSSVSRTPTMASASFTPIVRLFGHYSRTSVCVWPFPTPHASSAGQKKKRDLLAGVVWSVVGTVARDERVTTTKNASCQSSLELRSIAQPRSRLDCPHPHHAVVSTRRTKKGCRSMKKGKRHREDGLDCRRRRNRGERR
jgi:hypothetical protein